MSIMPSSSPGDDNRDKKRHVSVLLSQLLSSGVTNCTLLLKKIDVEKPSNIIRRRSTDNKIYLKTLEVRRSSSAGVKNLIGVKGQITNDLLKSSEPSSIIRRRSADDRVHLNSLGSRRCSSAGSNFFLNKNENENGNNKKEEKLIGTKVQITNSLVDTVIQLTLKNKGTAIINENDVCVNEQTVLPGNRIVEELVYHIRPKTCPTPNSFRRHSLDNKNDEKKKKIGRRKSTDNNGEERRTFLPPFIVSSSCKKYDRPSSEKVIFDIRNGNISIDDTKDDNRDRHTSDRRFDNIKDVYQNQVHNDQINNYGSTSNDTSGNDRRNSEKNAIRQLVVSTDRSTRSKLTARPKTSLQRIDKEFRYLKDTENDQNNSDDIKIKYTNNVDDNVDDSMMQQHENTHRRNGNNNLNGISERNSNIQRKIIRPLSSLSVMKTPKISEHDFPLPIHVHPHEPVLTPTLFFTSLLTASLTFVASFASSPSFTSTSPSEEERQRLHDLNIKNINDILEKVPYFILNNYNDNIEIICRIRKSSLPSIPKQRLRSEMNFDYKYNYFIFNDNNRDLINDINNEQIRKIWKISIISILFKMSLKSKLEDHRECMKAEKARLDRRIVAAGRIERVYRR